jgi:hypothetical protein
MPKITKQKKFINEFLVLAILQLGDMDDEESHGRGLRKFTKQLLALSFIEGDAEGLEDTSYISNTSN